MPAKGLLPVCTCVRLYVFPCVLSYAFRNGLYEKLVHVGFFFVCLFLLGTSSFFKEYKTHLKGRVEGHVALADGEASTC